MAEAYILTVYLLVSPLHSYLVIFYDPKWPFMCLRACRYEIYSLTILLAIVVLITLLLLLKQCTE